MKAIQFLSEQAWVSRLGWALVHFLWQGVVIAAFYAAARRWLGTSRGPQARYLLSCVALVVLVAAPVVNFVLDGSSDSLPSGSIATPEFSSPAARLELVSLVSLPSFTGHTWRDEVMPWLVIAWFAGAIAFWLRMLGGWVVAARMRSVLVRPAPAEWQRTLDALASRIRVSRPVQLLVSALVQVPTVIGWLRPVVLVPIGALAGLPAEHIEALLSHELAHIRRHDYLVNALQSVAEALLFYHPAVWWISKHVRDEREHCCDDIAAAIGGNVLTYIRALAELESARPARFRAAMAATGGSLARRIARLSAQSYPDSVAPSAPGIGAALLAGVTAFAVLAQPAARPTFEAAIVKPSLELGFMRVRPSPGRLTATASVRLLMENAYGVQPFQIAGGPDWIDSDQYEVEAKADGAASRDQLFLMLQSLLEDRFHLKVHRETTEVPVFALVAARNGLKLAGPQDGSCIDPDRDPAPDWAGNGDRLPPPGQSQPRLARCGSANIILQPSGARIQGGKITMAEFARVLAMALGRTVVDKTGFAKSFDVRLDFLPDESTAALPPPPPGSASASSGLSGPSVFSAIQEQLGLRLESTRGPAEVLVVDHVEKPSEN
jgi:uncharacterized protein (TIGR03435 family)